jgi:hypothetical protein
VASGDGGDIRYGLTPEWRAAVVDVERARQEYARILTTPHSEWEVDLAWLRLWRAERRRDELIR